MPRSTNKSQKDSERDGRERLKGGPIVPTATAKWWQGEIERIAKVENAPNFSLPRLMTRIADAGFDATLKGVEEYREYRRYRKKVTRT